VGSSELIREIYLFARNTGPAMSPFNAWVLSKSLETLAVRVEKHCENALKVAEFLENHPKGIETGKTFLNNIKMCSLSANLGDTRTIVTHPSSTTHGRLSEEDRLEVGITNGLVRISVGLENVKDIIEDLEQALR